MNELDLNKYGFHTIKNPPSQEELAAYYEKKYYQSAAGSYEIQYSKEEILYFQNKIKERLYVLKQYLGDQPENFLDIGCGEGWALKYFKNLEWDVLGLDYSSYGCSQFNPDCVSNLVTGDIYDNIANLIQKGEKYSVVWIDNVLEHVIDPELLINEIKKLIKFDGVLVIEVPNDFSQLQNYLLDREKVKEKFWVVPPDHLSYFNSEGLINLLTHNGFEKFDLISSYPIDINLLNDNTNYIEDKSKGKSCHKERVEFDNMIHHKPIEDVVNYYRATAKLGLGRLITGFFTLKSK